MRWLRTIAFFFILFSLGAKAQQIGTNSQYLLNHLSINPAYSGYHNTLALNTFYRFQYLGLDDSPNSQSFNAHMPLFTDYTAVGLQVWNQSVGVARQTGILASGAYRINTSMMTISMGLQLGIKMNENRYSSLSTRQPDDPVFTGDFMETIPSAGTGVLVYNEDFYAGLSALELIKSSDDAFNTGSIVAAGGYIWRVNGELSLKPNAMIRVNNLEVTEVNVNLTATFREILSLGAAYRPTSSITTLLQLYVTDQFLLGYTYDALLNDLSSNSSGSHEVGLQYLFKLPRRHVLSPRNF